VGFRFGFAREVAVRISASVKSAVALVGEGCFLLLLWWFLNIRRGIAETQRVRVLGDLEWVRKQLPAGNELPGGGGTARKGDCECGIPKQTVQEAEL
jgi:hypothetical protein